MTSRKEDEIWRFRLDPLPFELDVSSESWVNTGAGLARVEMEGGNGPDVEGPSSEDSAHGLVDRLLVVHVDAAAGANVGAAAVLLDLAHRRVIDLVLYNAPAAFLKLPSDISFYREYGTLPDAPKATRTPGDYPVAFGVEAPLWGVYRDPTATSAPPLS